MMTGVPPADRQTLAVALLRHWDVLAVADLDVEPEQEYLSEAGQVLSLLQTGRGPDEVAAYLRHAAAGLGAEPNEQRDRLAAEAVSDAYSSST